MSRKAVGIAIWAITGGILIFDLVLWALGYATISRAFVDYSYEMGHGYAPFLLGFVCGHLAWPLRPRKSAAIVVPLHPPK